MLRETFLVIAAILALAAATNVNECARARGLGIRPQVNITGCVEPPCKLRKRTHVTIMEKFVPHRDIKSLTTSVSATILSVPVPFIGVDGTDACNNIHAADNMKAGCPLEAGKEYIYTNKFFIRPIYPTLSTVVNWALVDNGEQITCFEAPSRITG